MLCLPICRFTICIVCSIVMVNYLLNFFVCYLSSCSNCFVVWVRLLLPKKCMVFLLYVCFVCGPIVCLDVPSKWLFCVVVWGKLFWFIAGSLRSCLFLVRVMSLSLILNEFDLECFMYLAFCGVCLLVE